MEDNKYILVGWPEIQDFMNHPDYSKKVFLGTRVGHPEEYIASTWFVPIEMYNDIHKL